MVISVLVITDSIRVGRGWGDDGPRSGYFPFYIGVLLLVSSGSVFVSTLVKWKREDPVFAEREQLRLVAAVGIPMVIYVGGVALLGIYLSSMFLIGYFMRRHGKFGWPLTASVAIGVPLVFYGRVRTLVPRPLAQGPARTSDRSVGSLPRMEELTNLMHGFSVALTPMNVVYMLVGITLGVLIGVLPGLGGANGIAILLPLTFSMNPTSAIIMLSCIYWGALFGGAITSILFNIPGEPWSVATHLRRLPDGAAGQGRAQR